MLTVTKRFEFCYGHRLPMYQGKCVNVHGHNVILEVEVETGIPGKAVYEGMIIDFKDLKQIVTDRIIEPLDHKYLNDLFPENPTCEFLCGWIVDQLKHIELGITRVRLTETPDSWAEWRRE